MKAAIYATERAMESQSRKAKATVFSIGSKKSVDSDDDDGITSASSDIALKPMVLPEISCVPNALDRWTSLVLKLSQPRECSPWVLWERTGIVPKFARNLFNNVEIKYGILIMPDDRKKYFSRFLKKASDSMTFTDASMTLTSSEMEQLLGPDEMGITKSIEEAREKVQKVFATLNSSYVTEVEYEIDRLDFEFFLLCVCESQSRTCKEVDPHRNSSKLITPRFFPIDPDSSMKQGWDIFCLVLLLYCSFSVPYSIAFLDDSPSGLSVIDVFGLAVDMVFMCDILLSFITAIEIDGIVVRDLQIISATYFRYGDYINSFSSRCFRCCPPPLFSPSFHFSPPLSFRTGPGWCPTLRAASLSILSSLPSSQSRAT